MKSHVALVAAAIVVVSGGLTTAAVGATTSLTAAGVPSVYTAAIRDALGARSFRDVATVTQRGYFSTGTEEAIVGGGSESESVRQAGARFAFAARLVDGVLYLNGDQVTLETLAQLSAYDAGRDAGRWIAVSSASSIFNELVFGLDATTAIEQVMLGAPITAGTPTTYRGERVIPLTSATGLHASTSNGPQVGSFTLYVTTGVRPLPVAEIVTDVIGKTAQKVTIGFSDWGHRTSLRAPSPVIHIG